MTQTNRQILLVEKPTGKLLPQNFKMAEAAIPEPKDGEVLLRVLYISLDAANRAWMQGATYRAAVEANTVMAGGAIAEVVKSNAPGFAPGDLVFGDTGWQDYAAVRAKHLVKVPRIDPITNLLSVYGVAGLTAYFGLLNVGKPKAGETVVVSAAAGSVGSFVGQIAKIKGCRVVGIGRQGEVQLAGFGARLRRCGRLQVRARVQGVEGRRAERHRRLFRQCLRRYLRGLPAADEPARPHFLLRSRLGIRRHTAGPWPQGRPGSDRGQAPDCTGLHLYRLQRPARGRDGRSPVVGEGGQDQGTGRHYQWP